MANHGFPQDIVDEARITFDEFDADRNGHITSKELGNVFAALGETVPGFKLRELIAEVDKDKNGTVEFEEFLMIYSKVSSKSVYSQWTSLVTRRESIQVQGGTSEASADGTTHTSSEVEELAFSDWINSQLKDDPDCKQYFPINTANLFDKLADGIILCKMINLSAPKTVDERTINKKKLTQILMSENNALMINSARSIGCTVVNIGPNDIIEKKQHLVLGLLWQIIRIGLFANITLHANPNIAVLLEEGETIEDLMKLTPEQLLLRWVNYHLRKSGSDKRINNFSGDIKDSEAYAILLSRVALQEMNVDRPERVMQIGDHNKRAEMVLQNADKINCRKFVTSRDIVGGNSKLNLAFVAHLFNSYPALDLEDLDEDVEYEEYIETREEKTYRNWMNSLGVNPFVYHLYNDLSTGLVLFQLYDDIRKGTVNWDRVNKAPFKMATGGNMKKIENCNYAVELGKGNNYSLVGIGGEDIYNGTKTLVMALVWQMLRHYTMQLLANLTSGDGGDGARMKDSAIVEWVNNTLQSAGKTSRISSFKDPSISSSMAVIDLCDAIKPKCVDYSLVTAGLEDADKELNAQYAVSMCRKIGAKTYALAEDITEVKPKMVLTLFACLMTRGLQK